MKPFRRVSYGMKMSRLLPVCLALAAAPLFGQPAEPGPLVGRIEGRTYFSPTGTFRVAIPVLPELGGRVIDTESAVTFQDDFNVFCTIAAVPMDATQRWELSTRGQKDYLAYFFANFVMPDFQAAFRGARVEAAKFSPVVGNGSLFTYMLLPGGSMFAQRVPFADTGHTAPEAKRGNLLVVRNDWVFIVSIELAERVLERSTYRKTGDEENEILRQRLIDLLAKIEFTPPPAPAGGK